MANIIIGNIVIFHLILFIHRTNIKFSVRKSGETLLVVGFGYHTPCIIHGVIR